MSEAFINSANTVLNHTGPLTVGAMLKSAREARGISIENVSERLHNSPRQINALENDQLELMPEPTITRGFIRNYARLLEIDAEPLLQAYRAQVPVNESPSINLPSANIVMSDHEGSYRLRYGWISIFVFVLVGIWYVYMGFIAKPVSPKLDVAMPSTEVVVNNSKSVLESFPAPVASEPVVAAIPVTELAKSETASATDTQSGQLAPVNPDAAATVANVSQVPPAAANTAVPAAGAAVVQLKFVTTEASWINVLDHDNKPIFNKTKSAASEDIVEGQPPFKLTLGNARATRVFLNGKLVDLQPYTKGNVARLTLP